MGKRSRSKRKPRPSDEVSDAEEDNAKRPRANTSDNEDEDAEDQCVKAIPVTILSGFLGSGKTTLLKHILTSKEHNLKIAVIVNDMAELNIDGQDILRSEAIVKTKKEVVTLENGCICCTLRGDLIREIQRIRSLGQFDYVLIESTGIAEPQQVAESFCVDPETQALAGNDSKMLWNAARLDTCVTVVDAVNFSGYLSSLKRFEQVFKDGLEISEEGEGLKSISELMVEQVEFANVIVLNKVDLASSKHVEIAKQLIKSLNPKARVVMSSFGKMDLHQILNTHLFNMEEAQESPGWLVSLKDGVTASEGEADEYGVSSFVYRQRKPFHPRRLHTFLSQFFCFADEWSSRTSEENDAEEKKASTNASTLKKKYGSILRSKGSCWIAGRDEHEMGWAQSGRIIQLSPTAAWYCLQPPEEWDVEEGDDEDIENRERVRIKRLFHDPEDESNRYEYGDRRQEIVFIGTSLGEAAIREGLDECLLTGEEMKQHSTSLPIGAYPDPLHPQLVSCHGGSSLFLMARQGQNQHIKIVPGSKLTLQNMALNVLDLHNENFIRCVKVWLDKTDSVKQHGFLLGTLRPQVCEHHSMSLELLPCDENGGEPVTNRRLRMEVVLKKNAPSKLDLMAVCEVHIMGKVEPLPYSEDLGDDDDDDEDDDGDDHFEDVKDNIVCDDGGCSAAA